VRVDRTVLGFTLAVSLLTSLLFALAPALYAAKAGLNAGLNAGLSGGRGSSEDAARGRARGALVIAEVALALLLVIGSGLMMQSLLRLAGVHPGFDARQVLAIVRTAGSPEGLAQAARRELAALDKDIPVADLRSVESILAGSVSRPRLYSTLLGIFTGVALLLAAVGIYGVMSYAVGQRTRELGLRMAPGDPAERVRGMILRQGLTLALAGIALGTAGAAALTRVMGDLLFGVSPTDPLTFVGASALLLAVASAAYFPARRATRVDPMIALRSE